MNYIKNQIHICKHTLILINQHYSTLIKLPSKIVCRISCIRFKIGDRLIEKLDEAFTTNKIQCISSARVGLCLIDSVFFLISDALIKKTIINVVVAFVSLLTHL